MQITTPKFDNQMISLGQICYSNDRRWENDGQNIKLIKKTIFKGNKSIAAHCFYSIGVDKN